MRIKKDEYAQKYKMTRKEFEDKYINGVKTDIIDICIDKKNNDDVLNLSDSGDSDSNNESDEKKQIN